MAITQVGGTETGTTTDPATSLTINKPATVAAGDVMIAGVTANNDTITAPAGWTEFEGRLAPTVAWQVRLYYKVVTGSEGASFSWTVGSGGPSAGFINCWRGVDNANPIDATSAATIVEANQGEPDTGPSVTAVSAIGRMMYIRAVRRTTAGGVTGELTTAVAGVSRRTSIAGLSASGNTAYVLGAFSADSSYTTSGSKSGLAISYSSTEATHYEATFALREDLAGSVGATLPKVTSSFAGEREPNSGAMAATLPSVTSSMAGTHYVPATGTLEATLPAVTASAEATVEPNGSMSASIAPVAAFGGETRQFGEHIIVVEQDHRAFLVVDDGTDVGLKSIKRSRVTQE